MGKKVKNLTLGLQKNTENTYYASWDFTEPVIYYGDPSSIKKGMYVGFRTTTGNKSTNGATISAADAGDTWLVESISGTNALLGSNHSKTKKLNSWVPLTLLYDFMTGTAISVIPVKNTKSFKVHWYYATGDGKWFDGGGSEVTIKNTTYSPPDNAISIRFDIKPVSTTYTEEVKTVTGNRETTTRVTRNYWTGSLVSKTMNVVGVNTPDAPTSAPTVEIDQYKIKVSVENIEDPKCDAVDFYFQRGSMRKVIRAKVSAARAVLQTTGIAGGSYNIRCRYVNIISSKKEIASEWSPWSYDNATAPGRLTKLLALKAASKTSVYIKWKKIATATGYDIEYSDHKEYFEGSGPVSSVTVDAANNFVYITGLGSEGSNGARYFFRFRVKNDAGVSDWTTGTHTVVLGTKPAAPTVWQNYSALGIGDKLHIYWIQNSEDGSDMTKAEMVMETTSKGVTNNKTISLTPYISKDEEKNSVYTIDTSTFKSDTTIRWKIRTAGITGVFGDWSEVHTVKIYVKPTVTVGIKGQTASDISEFPIEIAIKGRPNDQTLLGCNISIVSKNRYTTTDEYGDIKVVRAGESIFSRYYSPKTKNGDDEEFSHNYISLSLDAYDLDLETNKDYTLTCVASFNSGLTATATYNLHTNFIKSAEFTDMSTVSINRENISAIIRPSCVNSENQMPSNVLFSVYRREFDGSFTLIRDGIENENITIQDLHPALDVARYRIVTINTDTGKTSYEDISTEVLETSIIIQWKDQWSEFYTNSDATDEPVASSSMLRLPYDINISDNYSPDVELIEYTGRTHPVSYYGTQIGHSATWNVDILRDDKETLYQLRRLANWMDNVYVREPSGSGYWANVTVSFSQTHCELTIPVTLTVTRVEGGA